jgi:ribose transport system ATP-binding protein
LLILDEPTASISIKEADTLLEMIRRLQKQGMTFIYVSHKIEEVFSIANTVTVLRDGKNACAGVPMDELDRDKLIYLMVGRTENKSGYPTRNMVGENVALETKELRSKNSLKPNSFKLYKGEILGFYGLVGAGRTELIRALIGFDTAIKGEVCIDGKQARIRSVKEAMQKYGIVYVSENRQEDGLFLQHDIVSNIAVSVWGRISNKMGVVQKNKEREYADEYVKKLAIKTPGIYQTVNNLSGGNKQKVCIAKGLVTQPRILIFDEPTVGIDIKTKEEIHDLIWGLAQKGDSIIVISSDLPEIIKLADRILVFRNGQICGELQNEKDYERGSRAIMEFITTKDEKPA